MIKAVLFDYGGVLSEGGRAGCVPRSIAKVYKIDVSELANDADVFVRAPRGQITKEEYFAELNRRHPDGPRLNLENYLASQDIFEKSLPVYDLAARLRQNGIKTGILSNINDIAADELRRRGFYDGFDPIVLSYQEKMAKPDPKFYQLALERLGCAAEEVLFIDDQEKCRPPNPVTGMHFILAESPGQIVRDTEELILKENGLKL